MNTLSAFFTCSNTSSVAWSAIPVFSSRELVRRTGEALDHGARLCSWFGVPEDGQTVLVAVLAHDEKSLLGLARSEPVPGFYPSLTSSHPQAHLFEREVWEQCGIIPIGHPWLKPVRRSQKSAPDNAPFFRMRGGEMHEVAVGPIHAGVIGPGHFRFQCAGEDVLHLEIALGYQHRGIEAALQGGPTPLTSRQIEAVAGDSSIAHTTAYASILESLGGVEAPLRAQWLRAVALELERLACHTGDMGALAGDVAFLPTSAACGKIRGDFLNLTALLCGNRFGRTMVLPGGVRHDLEPSRLKLAQERLQIHLNDVTRAISWFWDAASVRLRFNEIGVVSTQQALDLGLVGLAARACGLVRDVRFDHPSGWHRFSEISPAIWPSGDILARAKVRTLEIQRSGAYLQEQLSAPVEGDIFREIPSCVPNTLSVALVEGWRGEVCHVALTGDDGRFRRYKITDPSFHNWSAMLMALRDTAIYDFPICNKSFNLSYCGCDL